jgi:hypothetical protein
MKTRFPANICGYENKTYCVSIANYYEPGQLNRYSDGLRAGRPGFDSRQGQEIFLFSTASRSALRPTQPPMQWVLVAFFPAGKTPGAVADHSLPSSAKVKNGGAIPPFPHTSSRRGA